MQHQWLSRALYQLMADPAGHVWETLDVQFSPAGIGEFKSNLKKSSYLCRCSFTGINGCHETFILLVDCHQEATTDAHAVAGDEARVCIY